MNKRTGVFFLTALAAVSNSYATNFSITGVIDGASTANLIVAPPDATSIVFGTGFNTATYQAFYSASNLSSIYTPNTIAVPGGFVNASSIGGGGYSNQPYNVYNITVRGSGVYTFQVTDPAHPVNYVRSPSNASTIDLMAALYVKNGGGTAFNAANTIQNLVMLSDDNSASGSANPYPMFFQNTNSTDCITLSLVYFPFSSVTTPAPVSISASGPGQIATSCAALGQNGVLSSLLTLNNSVAQNAAAVIDANPNLLNLFSALTTDRQRSNAVTQTLPLLTGGSIQAVDAALSGINRVIQARIENNRGLSSGDGFGGDKYVWIKPFGSWADQDNRNGVAGFKANTYGTVFGVDGTFLRDLRLGAAFAVARGDINGKSDVAPNSASVNVYQLIGYGSYSLSDTVDLNFQVDAGRNKTNGQRLISLTSNIATSQYDSDTAHVGVGVGKLYQLTGDTALTPSIRMDYTWIKERGYTETGAGLLNLTIGSRSTDQLVIGGDGKLMHKLGDHTTVLGTLGVGYDTTNKQASISAAYAGAPDAAFVTYGLKPSPWLARGGLGITYKTNDGLELSGRYDVEYRESFLNQTASLKLRWLF